MQAVLLIGLCAAVYVHNDILVIGTMFDPLHCEIEDIGLLWITYPK
jgi:hypothetical protein